MRVIGTAGHVDHGKSTLVEALTGMNPDRLKEEREREMTIELGFAWLTLPNGETVSVVDVPGHEDFIRHMLAGVGGIDLAMLVIAADESVMPQTREHLHILDLLQVPRGIVVLTKSDLVEEPDWLELVQVEISETLTGTVLEGSPMIPVAARYGQGIPRLLQTLTDALAESTPRPDLGKPRLSVDRVFSMSGFGTVVTGTLLDGNLRVGEEITILPEGRIGRIRGLQTHRTKVEVATPGRRLAVNVVGWEVNEIRRGDLLCHPTTYTPSRLIDVALTLLPDAPRPLRHNQTIEFYSGATQRTAHVRLIGTAELEPGMERFAQIRLDDAMALARGDRFIIRQPSPSVTIGGGRVLDATPRGRWRRFHADTLERFRLLSEGSPVELVAQKTATLEPTTERELVAGLPFNSDMAKVALAEAIADKRVRLLEDGTLLSAGGWTRRQEQLLKAIAAYHHAYPLRLGLPREEVASKVLLKPKASGAFLKALAEEGLMVLGETWVSVMGWAVQLSKAQQKAVDTLLAHFTTAPFTPPNLGDAIAIVGEELLFYLVARGDLVRVSPDVLLGRGGYEAMVQGVHDLYAEQGEVTAGALRDKFNTSRKFAIALLEHLDSLKLTRRMGDVRVVR
jgi:selenocysteine-specific elongation factor